MMSLSLPSFGVSLVARFASVSSSVPPSTRRIDFQNSRNNYCRVRQEDHRDTGARASYLRLREEATVVPP